MTGCWALAFSSGKVSVTVRLGELVDHRHRQVRGVGAEQFLEPLDAVGQLQGEADALTSLGQCCSNWVPIGDEDGRDLPVRELINPA